MKLQIVVLFVIVIAARTVVRAITIFSDGGHVAAKIKPAPYGFQRKWTQFQSQPQSQSQLFNHHRVVSPTKILKENAALKNTLPSLKHYNGHFYSQHQQQPLLVKMKKPKNPPKSLIRKPVMSSGGPWPSTPIKLNSNFVSQMYPQLILAPQQSHSFVPQHSSAAASSSALYTQKNKDFLDKSIDSPTQLNHLAQVPSINIKIIKQIGEKGPIRTIPAPNLSVKDKPNFSKSSLLTGHFSDSGAQLSVPETKYSLRNRTLSYYQQQPQQQQQQQHQSPASQQQQHQYQVNEDESNSNGPIYSASVSQSALPVRNSILILPSSATHSKRQRMPLVKFPVVPINLKVFNDQPSAAHSQPTSVSNYQSISFVQPANLEQMSGSQHQQQQEQEQQSLFPAQSFYQLETAGSEHNPIVIKYNNYSSVIKATSKPSGDQPQSGIEKKSQTIDDADTEQQNRASSSSSSSSGNSGTAAVGNDVVLDDDPYLETNPNIEDYYYISEEPSTTKSSKFGSKITHH